MKRLRPFFSYYGSKWRLAPLYDPPIYKTIIEPFAGSAAYATLYPDRNILLVDKNPIICQVWDYLIHVSESEFMDLPTEFKHLDEISVCAEAKLFIGFWLVRMRDHPGFKRCPMASKKTDNGKFRSDYWSTDTRGRLAPQLQYIRHWKVLCEDYKNLPDHFKCTWFVDPPYNTKAGTYYPVGKDLDFNHLGAWCESRFGQTIVCEMNPSNWLPFEVLKNIKNSGLANPITHQPAFYAELVWTGYT